jgi:hypothetical protein
MSVKGTEEDGLMAITHGYINRCMGKWVICHTRQRSFMGRLDACGGDHLVFYAPSVRRISLSMDEIEEQLPQEAVSLAWYGFGSVIVPLAAVVGLTVIGATAAAGFW